MKFKKKILLYLLLILLIFTPIFVVATTENIKNKSIKYEKPTIDEIIGDEEVPGDKESSTSTLTKEKEWYEYVTYSAKPYNEYIIFNKKYVYYDPYDYSFANIMNVEDVIVAKQSGNVQSSTSKIYDSFSTANEKEITYSVSNTAVVSASVNESIEEELEISAGYDSTYVLTRLKVNLGVSIDASESTDTSVSVTEKFNAVYFNSSGVPYSWKIVHYVVYIPVKVEVHNYIGGEWINTNEVFYILVPTVEGSCRQYIKNEIVYYEHWGTGEPVTYDEFWEGFFTKQKLIEALANRLLPRS